MMTFVTNRAPARVVRLAGREYVVANASLIVPGVLSGSNGPLLYPGDVVAASAKDWNDMPLTYGHPVINGRSVTAKTAGVDHLGRLTGSAYRDRLTADAWFDPEATEKVSPVLLAALRAARPVEVSTGLFTSIRPAPPGGGVYKGRPYVGVVTKIVPDHLAVLVGTVGACSLRDGCGIGVA